MSFQQEFGWLLKRFPQQIVIECSGEQFKRLTPKRNLATSNKFENQFNIFEIYRRKGLPVNLSSILQEPLFNEKDIILTFNILLFQFCLFQALLQMKKESSLTFPSSLYFTFIFCGCNIKCQIIKVIYLATLFGISSQTCILIFVPRVD